MDAGTAISWWSPRGRSDRGGVPRRQGNEAQRERVSLTMEWRKRVVQTGEKQSPPGLNVELRAGNQGIKKRKGKRENFPAGD